MGENLVVIPHIYVARAILYKMGGKSCCNSLYLCSQSHFFCYYMMTKTPNLINYKCKLSHLD